MLRGDDIGLVLRFRAADRREGCPATRKRMALDHATASRPFPPFPRSFPQFRGVVWMCSHDSPGEVDDANSTAVGVRDRSEPHDASLAVATPFRARRGMLRARSPAGDLGRWGLRSLSHPATHAGGFARLRPPQDADAGSRVHRRMIGPTHRTVVARHRLPRRQDRRPRDQVRRRRVSDPLSKEHR